MRDALGSGPFRTKAARRGGPPATRSSRRGFTIVELLMSLAVLTIGVAGVLGMQRVTISSNQHAKNLAMATRIAQAWIDELAADATLWTVMNGVSTLQNTIWLKNADPTQVWGWNVPVWNDVRAFGPGFDALGGPINPADDPGAVRFCTQIRLTFLRNEIDSTGTLTDTGSIRTQVRVFWPRDDSVSSLGGAAAPGAGDLCSVTGQQLDTDLDPANGGNSFHVVYLTAAVRETPRPVQ